MSKTIKSNYQIYKINDEKNTRNRTKMTIKLLDESSSINHSLPKKNNPILLTTLNLDSTRFNIRKELTKKLLNSERESYTYRNNMNNDESPFHTIHSNFNLNLFPNKKKKNYLKNLFTNFLNSLRNNYNNLFLEFESYFDLFINENEIIRNSDLYQYDLFKTVIEKYNKKYDLSKSDILSNNTIVFIFEELLKDYINLLSKNTSSKCTKFISIFLNCYKKVIIANYDIYSEKIAFKDDEIKNLRETINLYKERITNFERIQYDKSLERKNFEEIKKNLENIIEEQSNDIERLKEKINDLEAQISIKDYKIKMLSTKTEKKFSVININLNSDNEFYDEKLNYENLFKERLERIRYRKFKSYIKTKNINLKKNGK